MTKFWQYMDAWDHSTLILWIAIISAALIGFFTWRKEKVSDKQQTTHFNMDLQTNDLTHKLKVLGDSIDGNVTKSKKLSERILGIQDKQNLLIRDIDRITVSTGKLIEAIDQNVKYEAAKMSLTRTSGSLLPFEIEWKYPEFQDTKDFRFQYGRVVGGFDASYLITGDQKEAKFVDKETGEFLPFVFKAPDRKLGVYLEWKGLNGRTVIKMKDNKWRVPPELLHCVNHDASAFEMLDENENVLFNIEFSDKNRVQFQGYFPLNDSTLIVWGRHTNTTISREPQETFSKRLVDQLELSNVTKLFEYYGDDWFGKRNANHRKFHHVESVKACGLQITLLFQSHDLSTFNVNVYGTDQSDTLKQIEPFIVIHNNDTIYINGLYDPCGDRLEQTVAASFRKALEDYKTERANNR